MKARQIAKIGTRKKAKKIKLRFDRYKTHEYHDIASVIFVIIDKNQTIILINEKGCEVLGYREDELIGKNWFDNFCPENIRGDLKTVFKKIISGDFELLDRYENTVLCRSGKEKIIAWHTKVLKNDQGEIYATLSSGEDITYRRLVEKKLKESEQNFKTIFEITNDGILLAEVETDKLYAGNKKICQMLGYDEEEIHTLVIRDIHPETNLPLVFENLEKIKKGVISSAHDIPVKRKDGSVFYADITSSNPINIDGKTYLIGIFRDLTEQKKTKEALRKTKDKYRTLFEESKDTILISTSDGRVININPAGVELFGYPSKDEFMKVNILKDLYSDQGEVERFEEEVTKNGFVKDFEATLNRKDGKHLVVNITSTAVRNRRGKAVAYRNIMRDVTAHKELEQQLMQVQKMEALGKLTGGIAHDFKNILTVIMGNGNLLMRNLMHDIVLMESVDMIRDSSRRALNLIEGLLAFSKQQPISLKPINPNRIISSATKLLSRLIGEDIAIKIFFSKIDFTIMADHGQLEQVLINLVTNARDAMPNGGILTISTGIMKFDRNYIRAHGYDTSAAGKYALITIQDTGLGMDKKTQERIFEPFFTTKEVGKGTGLGLSIVYGIIKQHNGFIKVSSELGKGTTFEIYLPVVKLKEEIESRIITNSPKGTETILLAEDDEGVKKLIKKILEEFDYKVISASDGENAVKRFKENINKIQFLLLDVILPGKNGMQVYNEIRKINPEIKVLFMSGYTGDIISKKGIDEERLNFISKPILQADLLNKVREVLDNGHRKELQKALRTSILPQ